MGELISNQAGRRNDPEGAKTKIMDAAEELFAAHGYNGVSVRGVVSLAGLSLNKLTYHFGTKEELFRQVIARRAEEYVGFTEQALAAAIAEAGDASPTVEAIIRAYVTPALKLSMRGGGWKNYMQLLARSMNARQHEPFLAPVLSTYNPLLERIVSAFRTAAPKVDEERLHWAFYFLEAALIHILVEAGIVDRHSNGLCRSSDLEKILAEMVPFFAAGFGRTINYSPRPNGS